MSGAAGPAFSTGGRCSLPGRKCPSAREDIGLVRSGCFRLAEQVAVRWPAISPPMHGASHLRSGAGSSKRGGSVSLEIVVRLTPARSSLELEQAAALSTETAVYLCPTTSISMSLRSIGTGTAFYATDAVADNSRARLFASCARLGRGLMRAEQRPPRPLPASSDFMKVRRG